MDLLGRGGLNPHLYLFPFFRIDLLLGPTSPPRVFSRYFGLVFCVVVGSFRPVLIDKLSRLSAFCSSIGGRFVLLRPFLLL